MDSPAKPAAIGLIGTIIAWICEAFAWYSNNIPLINQWLVHIAQIVGLIIAAYSLRILRRNWKTGKNFKNPLD